MTALPLPIRRAVAIGLLCLSLVLLWSATVRPLLHRLDELDRSLAQRETLLARSRHLAAERRGLEAQRSTLRNYLASKAGFLQGNDADLVAAGLQERIKRTVLANGGDLKSLQTLRAEGQSGFAKIALRVAMTADTPALQKIFHRVETASPRLFLDNLNLKTVAARVGRNASEETDLLQVRFDVYGFLREENS